MRSYTQLTQYHRYHIRIYLKVGYSLSRIAKRLKFHKSPIRREIRRNQGQKGYRPKHAHELAMSRRFGAAKRVKLTPSMIELVNHFICRDFSPEQVV